MSASRTSASPRRAPRTQPSTVGWLAIIVFLFLAGLGVVGAIASVAVYNSLSSGLADPHDLTKVVLQEQSIVYDRTGKIELARFGSSQREVVTFDQIPKVLVDATTAVEDKTFWDNAGFDPVAIFSAALDSLRGNSRGASTITQQLVRNVLLDEKLVQDPHRSAERKLKEIIQSIRLTQAFPGETGKQTIITAYLNQNYYGNQTYGVKAAAEAYFGIDLSKIDPAQAAILAGLPKSPSNYDLVRNAIEKCTTVVAEGADCPQSQLVVPPDTAVVQRRNAILDLLAQGGRTPQSGDQYSAADFTAAKSEPVVLGSQATARWIAPHFVWAVRDELTHKLCGADAETCPALVRGGLRVTTTLDVGLQKIAEKWVRAAAIVPHAKDPNAAAKALGFKGVEPWMTNLKNKNLRNGALVALDYQTGELVAYVGSASYYANSTKPEFQPQYDVVGQGFRQPGSAFKPFNYVTGIDDHTITAGTMLMDVGTDFGGNYKPDDADNLERGPVRVRNALQFSLNIPSVKTMAINGPDHVFAKAQEFGMQFQTDKPSAGLSLALGTQEVRPVDLVTAYGTLANGGKMIPHTTILTVQDSSGKDVVPAYVPPAAKPVVSPQAAWIVTDILAGNTNPNVNPFWGKFSITGPDGRRPATLKTGTNNDARDLNAYGYIAPPTAAGRDAGAYALAVGVWNGNSDNSLVSTAAHPVFSIDVSTFVWQGFLQEASKKWPETNFKRPADGLVKVAIDPFTGLKATSGTKSVDEWFIATTEPHDVLSKDTCGIDVVARVGYESKFPAWMAADRDWIARAQRGPGVAGGPNRTRTAYFYNGVFRPYGATWGVMVDASCGKPSPSPTCFPIPTPDPSGVIPSFAIPSPSGSGVAGASLPTSEQCAVAVAVRECAAVRAATKRDAAATTHADPGTNAGADAQTDSEAKADTDANARNDTGALSGTSGTLSGAVTGPGAEPADHLRAGAAVVELQGVTVRRGGRTILGPIDWTVRAGERWVVIGPNGSGKTTLLSVVGLTLWPTTGTVDVLGQRYGKVDSRDLRRRIGSAGSAVEALLRDELTPVDIVMTAAAAATEPWWHAFTDEDRARARGLLDELGIGALADRAYGTLSAGERRRTSIARALMPDPDLLLLDEPAANLDLGARETLVRDVAVLAAADRPRAIILVTHHVEEIPPGFSHCLVLANGGIVAAGPIDEVLTTGPLSIAFDMPIVVERRDGRAWARLGTG